MSIINQIQVFKKFTQEDRDLLESFSQERVYQAGDKIFSQGDDSTAMYIIIDGRVSIKIGEKVVAYLSQGDFLGEMSFFSHDGKEQRSADVFVELETKVFIIHEYSIKTIFEKYPVLHSQLKEISLERLKENSEK